MDYNKYLEFENTDAGFKALSYDQQRKVRQAKAGDVLPTVPGFSDLDDPQKLAVLEEFVNRKPVLENDALRPAAEKLYNDPKVGAFVLTQSTMNSSDVIKGFNSILTKMMPEKVAARPEIFQMTTGRDSEKIKNYLLTQADKGDRRKGALKALNAAGGLLGFGTDFVSLTKMMPAATAPVNAIGKKLVAASGSMSSKVGSWAVGKLLPQLTEETVEGAILTAKDVIAHDIENPDDKMGMGEVAKTFGITAAFDYAINAGLVALGTGARTARTIFKGYPDIGDISATQYKGMWETVKEGKPVKQEILDRASPAAQDMLINYQKSTQYAKMGDGVLNNYEGMAYHYGNRTGTIIRPLEDGKYRLRFSESKFEKNVVANSIDEVYDVLGKRADDLLNNYGKAIDDLTKGKSLDEGARLAGKDLAELKEEMAERRAAFEPILKYQRSGKNATEVFETFGEGRAKGYVKPSKRKAVATAEADSLLQSPNNKGYIQEGTLYRPLRAGERADSVISQRNVADFGTYSQVKAVTGPRVQGQDIDVEDAVKIELRKQGFDSAVVDKSGIVRPYVDDAVKKIDDNLDPITGTKKISDMPEARQFDPKLANKTFVDQQFQKIVSPERIATNPKQFVDVASNIVGDVDPKTVQGLGRILADNMSMKGDVLAKTADVEGVSVTKTGDTIEITTPKRVETPSEQREFVRGLVDGMNKSADEIPKGTRRVTGEAVSKVLEKPKSLFKVPDMKRSDQLKWVQGIVDDPKNMNVDTFLDTGKLGYLEGDTQRTFDSLDEFTDFLVGKDMKLSSVNNVLRRNGARAKSLKDGTIEVTKNGKVLSTGRTPVEALAATGLDDLPMPAKYAPKLIKVDEAGATFEATGKLVSGGKNKVLKFMDNFHGYEESQLLEPVVRKKDGTGIVYKHVSGNYEVHMPSLGVHRTFDSMKDARLYMEREWKEASQIQRAARDKGFDLFVEDGRWALVNGDTTLKAKNYDELEKIFRNNPDADFSAAPEFSTYAGADEAMNADGWRRTEPLNINSDPPVFGLAGPMNTRESIYQLFDQIRRGFTEASRPVAEYTKPADVFIKGEAARLGHKFIGEEFERLQDGMKLALADITDTNHQIEEAFQMSGKAPMKRERRKALFRWMTAADSDKAEIATAEKLTREELQVAEKIRDVFGHDRSDGLFLKFGIDPQRYIFDYLPKIRRAVKENPRLDWMSMTSSEISAKVFNSKVPPAELDFWAEHPRSNDVFDMAHEDDPMRLMIRYNTQGHKRLYMNESWRNIDKYIKTNKKFFNENGGEMVRRLLYYREHIMSQYVSPGERRIKEMGRRLANAFSDDPAVHDAFENVFNHLISLNYMVNMAWRPWLPIRNITQPMVTLAPRFGNSAVGSAYRMAIKEANELVPYLKGVGIIKDQGPFLHLQGGIEGNMSRLAEKSMTMFKRSDEIDRVIAYVTVRESLADGWNKFQKGILKSESELLEYTNMNLIDEATQKRALTFLRQGKTQAATDIYAARVIDDTMFDYSKPNAPKLFTSSVLGKTFGQYGTWSVGYLNNLLKGFTRGTPAQQAAFVARWVGNMGALSVVMEQMQIQNNNFLPWSPIQFTGGPYFNMGMDLLQSIGGGYQADQARARLTRVQDYVTPTQLRYLKKAIGYMEEGEPWKAFLSFNTVPIHYDHR